MLIRVVLGINRIHSGIGAIIMIDFELTALKIPKTPIGLFIRSNAKDFSDDSYHPFASYHSSLPN
jgi:hypothetical protein